MRRARKLTVIVPALLLVLTSGALAESQQMEQREDNPTPDISFKSEMPPPLASDTESEKTNRRSNSHLEEYQERDQGIPTGMAPESKKSDKMNRPTPKRVSKTEGKNSDKMDRRPPSERVNKNSPLDSIINLLTPGEFF